MSEGKWIRFEEGPPSASGKTRTWSVVQREWGSGAIGEVAWYAPWRKYVFEPRSSIVFEQICLRDIADFIEARTREQRAVRMPEIEPAEDSEFVQIVYDSLWRRGMRLFGTGSARGPSEEKP